jgi:hypothetical protein
VGLLVVLNLVALCVVPRVVQDALLVGAAFLLVTGLGSEWAMLVPELHCAFIAVTDCNVIQIFSLYIGEGVGWQSSKAPL